MELDQRDRAECSHSPHLEATLAALRNAKCDTEKFSAILVLTKAVNPALMSEAIRSRILNDMGVPFLTKLLLVTDCPSECPPEMFQSLAVQILTTFASHSDVSAQLLPAIEALKPLLQSEDKELKSQVFSCLSELSKHQFGCETLLQLGFGPLLANAYKNEGISEALNILATAVDCSSSDISEAWLEDVLKHAAERFRRDQGSHKFELCRCLSSLLSRCAVPESSEHIIFGDLRCGLKDMLTSRLGSEMRTAAFTLLGSVLCKYGSPFIAEWDDSQFSLAITLAGTEVQLQLLEKPDVAILIPCYQILEVAFQNMDVISASRLNQVLGCVRETFKSVITFMLKATENETDDSMVLATARVLCAWLAEDSTCLRNQVAQVLPILLRLASEQKQLIPLLVPGLCHVTADDKLRPVVVFHNSFLLCLVEYLSEQWNEVREDSSAAERLETACGVFLNIVILEQGDFLEHCTIALSDLLVFCLKNTPDVPQECIELKGNLVVLGLFLLKLQMKKTHIESGPSSDSNVFKKFLAHAVQFVKTVQQCGSQDSDEISNLQSLSIAVLQEMQESDSELGAYIRRQMWTSSKSGLQ
ncbi:neurochondrin-like [Ornithodoros turicata]|uniref:neurochondrin-like n=1 Tax=Ornithodoros turicata TaxID=34597 RepID=UPI0031398DB3